MNLEDDILIERFLRDALTASEKEHFLYRLDNDAVFKKKVDFERELLESLNENDWHFIEDYNKEKVDEYKTILKTKELTDLKEELKRVNKEFNNSSSKVKHVHWKRILVSSAAVLAIMFSVYLFTNSSVSSQELYTEFYNSTELPSLVSRDDTSNSLSNAQVLFENENYQDALNIINEELQENSDYSASLLIYKGVSEMQLNNFNSAEITFNTLINSDALDAEKGYWYKALLYLKQDDPEKAKTMLNKIITNTYYNFNNAKTLLNKLN